MELQHCSKSQTIPAYSRPAREFSDVAERIIEHGARNFSNPADLLSILMKAGRMNGGIRWTTSDCAVK